MSQQGQPDYLSGEADPGVDRRDRTKRLAVAGGILAVLALGGAGAWAAAAFLGTGAQPAEALPADTLGYVAVDLDPSGGQKVEAIQTLRKFPEFRDRIGLQTDDDLREKLFEYVQGEGECEGIDYARDVEGWLGNRMAVAALDLGGDEPTGIVVLQVTDAGAAEEGLTALGEACAEEESLGFAVEGDWAVLAGTDEEARDVADAATGSSLAEDADYARWTDAAGGTGILTAYVAPEAGAYLLENFPPAALSGQGGEPPADTFADFEGAAATVRFADEALEVEMAGQYTGRIATLFASGSVADTVGSLPEDTTLALGAGFEDGWLGAAAEQFAEASGSEVEDLYATVEDETGLSLPEDVETLLGEAAVLAVGGDFDPETLLNSTSTEDLPVGVRIRGEQSTIDGVLAKVAGQLGPEGAELVETEGADGYVALSPSPAYRSRLAEGGDLAGTDRYRSVVTEPDRAAGILFLDLDAGWLAEIGGSDPKAEANLEPLSALGMSVWTEDQVAHAVLRIATD